MVLATQHLVVKHASRGLLIDTNVLLLYLVGIFDKDLIERFKRTRSYNAQDFALLANLVCLFARIVTTPHILAELSNLSLQMKEPRVTRYFDVVVETLRTMREEYLSKDSLLASRSLRWLPRIGFTDLSIIEAASIHKYLVLTDDFTGAQCLHASNCDVINFNHIRGELWLSQ